MHRATKNYDIKSSFICSDFLACLGSIIIFYLQANTRRDPNYDWQYGFVTFAEHLAMAREKGFAVIPEIKQSYAVNKVRSSEIKSSFSFSQG